MKKYFLFTSLLTSIALLFTGCSTAGLANIPQTRENYNTALNQSDNQQFLLNIVRMHFDKSPYFIGVDSLTTQTTLAFSTGGDDTKFFNATSGSKFPPLGAFWNFQPNVEFTQKPTITYSPLQGTSYISGLLTPIDVTKFYYLIQANLSLASVFKMTVDQVGPLNNEFELAHNRTSSYNNQNFNNFVNLIDQFRQDKKASIFIANYQNNLALVLNINDDNSAAQISHLLNLNKPYRQIIFSRYASTDKASNVVKFYTRSFFAVLSYLSHGIQTESSTPSNFQPSQLTNGLFTMYSTTTQPTKMINQVEYDGKWYYVANKDVNSKATLILLKMMYSLQAGEVTDSTWSILNIPQANE